MSLISNDFPGEHVKLSARRLRQQYLPEPATAASYVKVTFDGNFAGNTFAYRWELSGSGETVCWVTQLVVDRNYRGRGLASGLLRSLRSDQDGIYGIMSSHPVACLAAASSFGSKYCLITIAVPGSNSEQKVLRRYPLIL